MHNPKYKFRHPKYKFRHPNYSGISSDTQIVISDTQSISSTHIEFDLNRGKSARKFEKSKFWRQIGNFRKFPFTIYDRQKIKLAGKIQKSDFSSTFYIFEFSARLPPVEIKIGIFWTYTLGFWTFTTVFWVSELILWVSELILWVS